MDDEAARLCLRLDLDFGNVRVGAACRNHYTFALTHAHRKGVRLTNRSNGTDV